MSTAMHDASILSQEQAQSIPSTVRFLVYYLVFTALYFLTGFYNLIPVQVIRNNAGLKGQTFIVFFVALTILGMRSQVRGIFSFPLRTNLLVFLGFVLLSVAVGMLNLGEDFFKLQRESASYFSLPYFLVILALIVLMIKVHQSFSDFELLLKVWLVLSAVTIIIARITSLGINWYDLAGFYQSQEREAGIMSLSVTEVRGRFLLRESFLWLDTNVYASLVVIGILIAMYFLMNANGWRRKLAIYGYVLLAGSSLIASSSRSAVLQLLAGFVTFTFLVRKSNRRSRQLYFTLALVVTGVLSFYYGSQESLSVFVYRMMIASDFVSTGPTWVTLDGAAMSRYLTATMAWDYFVSHPLVGSGGIQYATIGFTTNHSEILNYLSQFGIFAWGALILLYIRVPWNLLRLRSRQSYSDRQFTLIALLVALNAVCAVRMLTDPNFYTYWIVVAASIAFLKVMQNDSREQTQNILHTQEVL